MCRKQKKALPLRSRGCNQTDVKSPITLRQYGTHHFYKVASSWYLTAFQISVTLTAWAVSGVFIPQHRNINPLMCMILQGAIVKSFSYIISRHLWKKLRANLKITNFMLPSKPRNLSPIYCPCHLFILHFF